MFWPLKRLQFFAPVNCLRLVQGTRSALYANDRESISVTVQEVTPRSVGGMVALYERAVGLYASIININAYHQPGKYNISLAQHSVFSLLMFLFTCAFILAS